MSRTFAKRYVLCLAKILCMAVALIPETNSKFLIQIHWDNNVVLSQNAGLKRGKNIIPGLFSVNEKSDVCPP